MLASSRANACAQYASSCIIVDATNKTDIRTIVAFGSVP